MATDVYNAVEFYGQTLISVSSDTVTPETLAQGVTAHDAAGNPIVGVMVPGAEPVEQATPQISVSRAGVVTATAVQAEGAVAAGTKSVSHTLDSVDDPNFNAANIRSGISIFGKTGTYAGGDIDGATAEPGDVLSGKSFYGLAATKENGTMANNGAVGGTISTKDQTITIPGGYTSGGNVSIASDQQDLLISANIRQGVTVLGVEGSAQSGTDTSDATAEAAQILYGYSAYGSAGTKLIGTLPNNGGTGGVISTKAESVTIPEGYTSGGSVSISAAQQALIVPGNIRSGVSVLGISGSYSGTDTSDATATAAQILSGYTAYGSAGTSMTGTIQTYDGTVEVVS